MKKKLILAAAAVAVALPAAAVAHRGFQMEPPTSRVAAIETAEAHFAQVDSNGDGRVTQEELVARAQARATKMAEHRFERQDTNDDGVITEDEITEKAAQHFDLVDTNGDGFISDDEAERARPFGPKHGRGRG